MIERVVQSPEENVFCGNPVVFDFNTTDDSLIVLDVSINGVVKSLSYHPFHKHLRFDISGLFDAFFSSFSLPENTGQIIQSLPGFFVNVSVKVRDHDYSFGFRVFRGGISTRLFRQIKESGYSDVFSCRLNNPSKQFLFTTRTNSRNIELYENELYPFVFIHPGKTISFLSFYGNLVYGEQNPGEVCTMDIEAVRREFLLNHNELPSFISVQVDGRSVFSFTIKQAPISSENYVLLFQNSLGAYEKFAVSGKAEMTPEFEDKEGYSVLSDADCFENYRGRLKADTFIEVETGYRTAGELRFLTDLIQSSDVHILLNGIWERCFIEAGSFSVPLKMTKPVSVPLKIRLANSELYFSAGYDSQETDAFPNLTEPGYPEINSDGFIKQDETTINID